MVRLVRAGFALLIAVAAALCIFSCRREQISAREEGLEVRFEDGSIGVISYAEALSGACAGDAEYMRFLFGDRAAAASGSGEYRGAYRRFEEGSLAELLSLDLSTIDRFSRLALLRTFGDTLYYAEGAFRLTGTRVTESTGMAARVVLLDGTLEENFLIKAQADELVLRGGELFAGDLAGSAVSRIVAEKPYHAAEDALYLDTVGGRRLIAGMPLTQSLNADMAYADMGALAPCTRLVSLTLPFLGAREAEGLMLTDLFGGDPPETLATLKISGGEIVAGALYGTHLSLLDLCGVAPQNISSDLFYGAKLPDTVIAPKEGLLEGYAEERLPCGCICYRSPGSDEYQLLEMHTNFC